MKLANFGGTKIESIMKKLPDGFEVEVQKVLKAALEKAYDTSDALSTYSFTPTVPNYFHKVAATVSGAIGGVAGLPGAVVELPVTVTTMFSSCMARCSTPHASGSSPSVSAKVSLSTSPQVSSGITQRGRRISSPMGSTRREYLTHRSGRSSRGSGYLQSSCCEPQTYPRPASLRGWSGGGMATDFFFGAEEELSWSGQWCQSQRTAAKNPK